MHLTNPVTDIASSNANTFIRPFVAGFMGSTSNPTEAICCAIEELCAANEQLTDQVFELQLNFELVVSRFEEVQQQLADVRDQVGA